MRLMVNGQPFLVRGGEIGNSSATSPAYLAPFWTKFQGLHLNTLIVPVYWDQIEPEEGSFDFATVDQLLGQARQAHLHLVLLWFGSWKNSMSCYVPGWIKENVARFPRTCDLEGRRQEMLSPLSEENQQVDSAAFGSLLRHLRETDGALHTVLLVQVENEIGMIPNARDHAPEANRLFAGPVPADLAAYLRSHRETLAPELARAWTAAGARDSGTWTEMFGAGLQTDEIFMAWHFARYTDAVAAAGKREYPLPMYVNAALMRPGYRPGQYPSAGPLPQVFDVWRAAAPHIDLLSPDIYFTDFARWARAYHTSGNALFIPEAKPGPEASVNAFFAFADQDALGFSPFAIDSISGAPQKYLTDSYRVLSELQDVIVAHQGDGSMAGLMPDGPEQLQPRLVQLGGFQLLATFEPQPHAAAIELENPNAPPAAPLPAGGLVIALGPKEFLIAGTAMHVAFSSLEPGLTAGLLSVEEGDYVNGRWQPLRRLSGDQTNQGRFVRLEGGKFSIQRVRLYTY
jgi:hypothetical protein